MDLSVKPEPEEQGNEVFTYYPDCSTCPANAFQMGQANGAIWVAIMKSA